MGVEKSIKSVMILTLWVLPGILLWFSGLTNLDALPEYTPLIPPDALHFLGTDNSGRDILTLLIRSAGVSLSIGLGAALFAVTIGAVIGCSAGYLGSPVDDLLMRLTDVFLLIPSLPLVIVISAYLGPGAFHVALVISITTWPATARIIYAHVLKLREQLFIINAKSMGAGTLYLMVRHILPNCSELLIAKAALTTATAMLTEAGISFLGLGDPMYSSWGSMLHDAFSGAALINGYVWWYLPPVLCISFSVVLFNWAGHRLSTAKPLSTFTVNATAITPSVETDGGDCTDKLPKASILPFVAIQNLKIAFPNSSGQMKPVVNQFSLDLTAGEKAAVIGETGSGKSLLLLSLLRLLPAGATASGSIRVQGVDLSDFSPAELRRYRGALAAYVPQGLGNALNPVLTVGYQVGERMRIHQRTDRDKVRQTVLAILSKVGFSTPEQLALAYPHQLSGGMKQRVLTAMALSNDPALILADEPTKGLDQEAVNDMVDIIGRLDSQTLLAVTHDLTFAKAIGEKIIVMHSGIVMEEAPADSFFNKPLHPYSKALVAAWSGIGMEQNPVMGTRNARLITSGCPYVHHCSSPVDRCKSLPPLHVYQGHSVRCWRHVS